MARSVSVVQTQPSPARCTDPSSEMQSKPGTLVKSPHRMLAVQQTGLQAVDSRTPGSQRQDQPQDGHCPKGSAALCIPEHAPAALLALRPHPPGSARVLGPEPRCGAHTGAFVRKDRTHEQRASSGSLCKAREEGPGWQSSCPAAPFGSRGF